MKLILTLKTCKTKMIAGMKLMVTLTDVDYVQISGKAKSRNRSS